MTLQVILTGKDVKAGFLSGVDTTNTKVNIDALPSDTRIGTLTANANIRRLYTLGDRYIKGVVIQKFEGSIGIDLPLYSGGFLSNVLSNVDIGDLFVIYPTFGRYIKNVVPQRVEISIREDELVRISIDGVYVSESLFDVSGGAVASSLDVGGTDVNGYALAVNDVVAIYPTHINASITSVDGVTNVTVRSATIRVNLNNELKWGIGSRYAQAVAQRQIEVEVTIEAILSKDMLTKVLGDTQNPATITFTITAGGSTITITVDGAYLDSVSEPLEPNNEVYATLTYIGKSITVG